MDQVKKGWSKLNRWHKGLLIIFIVESRLIPGGQIGFTCNDPALSHPYTGDTISWKHLLGTVILLPLAVMLVVERKYQEKSKPNKLALRWYKEYIFGVLINLIAVETIKLVVGAPRPHFFDTCSPHEAATCQGSEYVPRYTCSNVQGRLIAQSDRSFPSGHTSLALHASIFLIYYLHARCGRCTAVSWSQVALLACAGYCAVSRVIDHRHHWWDVLTGALLGYYLHARCGRCTAVAWSQVALLACAGYCAVSRVTDHRHHWWDVLTGAVLGLATFYYTINNLCCYFEMPIKGMQEQESNKLNETDTTILLDTKPT